MAHYKKVKKEFGELVINEKSDFFYKAFCFPEQDPDMIVDTSTDTFSMTPEDAIYSLFEQMPTEVMNKIPNRMMFTFDDQEVDYDESQTSPYAKDVILLRLFANNKEQFDASKKEGGDHDFVLALKELTDGYTMQCQDYTMELLEVKSDPGVTVWRLKHIRLKALDPDRKTSTMPDEIRI
jgi:hypothetical protein